MLMPLRMAAFGAPPPGPELRAAMAEEERGLRSELGQARRAANRAQHRLASCSSEAAVALHSVAALAAKRSCEVEQLRAAHSRSEVDQRRAIARMDAANSLVAATEQLNYVVRETMGAEIALLEARRMETAEQLLTMVASYKLLGEQLWTTQEQAARAHALLEQQQAQLTEMQKRLTAQQRRAVRLQSEVHAARLVMTEHAKVQEAAAEVPRLKEQAAQHLLVQRTLSAEAAQEREASIEALERVRHEHDAEQQATRARLLELETLLERLLADGARVQPRSGASCTVGEYVRSFRQKLEREQSKQRGGAAPSAPPSQRDVLPPRERV